MESPVRSRFTVEHMVGTQGGNERMVDSMEVCAIDEFDAINQVAGLEAAEKARDMDSGHGGAWCDYWMASKDEPISNPPPQPHYRIEGGNLIAITPLAEIAALLDKALMAAEVSGSASEEA
jgi:hypothetical protein